MLPKMIYVRLFILTYDLFWSTQRLKIEIIKRPKLSWRSKKSVIRLTSGLTTSKGRGWILQRSKAVFFSLIKLIHHSELFFKYSPFNFLKVSELKKKYRIGRANNIEKQISRVIGAGFLHNPINYEIKMASLINRSLYTVRIYD